MQHWLARLKGDYSDAMLAVDADVSELWGAILAATDDTNAVDNLIAAAALHYDLTLVTRTTDHVAGTGVRCINPFTSG